MSMHKVLLLAVTCISMFSVSTISQAEVRLPRIFGNHMVLQRDQPIPVWGWADPGENVSVALGSTSVSTVADKDGKWTVKLPAQKIGNPVTLTAKGKNTITFTDVLIGEVWLCSGQSNMEWTVARSNDFEAEKAAANYAKIRHIKIPKVPNGFPQDDVKAEWTTCSPDTVGNYTAVGYFFGRKLHKELDVPIGLINSSWGGTRIDPWTPPVGFSKEPKLAGIFKQVQLTNPANAAYQSTLAAYLKALEAWVASAKTSLKEETALKSPPAYPAAIKPLTSPGSPTTLYNGMIHPLVPFAIRGAIWYQGESNHNEGMLYYNKMKALIGGWREVWKQGEFPFLYVQIAPWQYGSESPGILPLLWEAQNKSLEIPNTGQAVIHDIGNLKDIHPKNKQDVGARLALIALAKTYGKKELVYSGPVFKSLKKEGAKLRVTFDHVGSGLVSRDGKPLNWFEIIGKETDFVPAQAVIDGDSVILSSPKVKEAVAMRFAWHKLAEPNLANKEGLPAAPFRAGKVPDRDWLSLKVDEAKQYKLIYDLDLKNLGQNIKYNYNASPNFSNPFDRIAYFLELQKTGGETQYVYVSMDAFTDDVTRIGVPTLGSKAKFQKKVDNLNVVSNVAGIKTGNGLTGGNIEFWPHNYGPANAKNIPNASASLWDFGDEPSDPSNGYGCMQVHNYEAKQTLFAINHWNSGPTADIGIGNSTGKAHDWTFAYNASQYETKRLRVLVRTK
ncbi:MAG: 9-O-acetylesterase [Planctomycetes bacterium]|nr:9-O-acetylesterase [Planctomycetota bacterium]MCH9723764.1 9-O-acetylesterase [Planctomycetota bacterium]MCH9776076.1 9-O-acetylesterase [Planctomycetota bacterium]MCH9789817.1 9-O-acetylesterase [Planctomycetota bacterium]